MKKIEMAVVQIGLDTHIDDLKKRAVEAQKNIRNENHGYIMAYNVGSSKEIESEIIWLKAFRDYLMETIGKKV